MLVWEGLCYFDRNSTTIIYIFLLNEKMKPTYPEYFNQPQTHNLHKTRRFKYYILIKSQLHLGYLCCIYEEIKAWTGLLAVKNKMGFFFFKDYITTSSFFLHLLIGNIRQELS